MKAEYDFSQGKRGALMRPKNKTRITIYLDNDILDTFRARAEEAGTGYQTLINQALKRYLNDQAEPLTESVLRRVTRDVLRQELAHLAVAGD